MLVASAVFAALPGHSGLTVVNPTALETAADAMRTAHRALPRALAHLEPYGSALQPPHHPTLCSRLSQDLARFDGIEETSEALSCLVVDASTSHCPHIAPGALVSYGAR